MRVRFHPGDPSAAYYATDARAHSILIGAFLAVLLLAWRPGPQARRALAIAAFPAILVVLIATRLTSGTGAHYYHGGSALFAVVVAVLIAGILQPGPVASVLSWRPLVWIGTISYGLYLWHWPIAVWLVPSRVHVGTTTLNLLRLAVTFAAATASYYLLERPIRERRWPPRVAAVVFVPTAVVMTGLITVSAVGASALPGFIWGYGDPLLCGTPRPTETREAITAEAKSGPLALTDAAHGQRVLLVGDSTACSLWPGLNAVGNTAGIATDQGSVFGCGVASGEITTTRNEAITPHSSRCPALVDSDESKALARARPTLVIWMSIWEKSDLVVDGKTVVAGTPAGEKEIMARMDAALARLTAGGAHVALVTEAAPAPNPAQGTLTTSAKADNDGYVRLNALLRRFQARHPGTVTLVDLATKLCPTGPPCPAKVDGLHAASRRTALHPDRGDVGRALHPHADVRAEMTAVLAPADDAPEAQPVSRGRRIALAAPAYLPALMIAIGGWQHRWMDEDAFINLRIVDQIFAGHGPVFNAGERVEAATSTIWLGVLVIGRLLFGSFTSMEWITLLASLGAAVAAFAVAGKATRLLHRGDDGVVVPVGLILVASVAVVWDFSTSGLEMGLVWLWIAASWYVLVSVARTPDVHGRKRFGFGVLLGLAPLVRPDLGLMMLCFVAAWFVLVRPRRIIFDLVAIFALPVAYQIFRMGYYATVVPTTALAKDASGLHLGQGWAYAKNFIGPYRLWLSAIVIVAAIVYRGPGQPRSAARDRHGRNARGRTRARAVHHRHRRRLHARAAAAPRVLRVGSPRVRRGPDRGALAPDRVGHRRRRGRGRVGAREHRRVPSRRPTRSRTC